MRGLHGLLRFRARGLSAASLVVLEQHRIFCTRRRSGANDWMYSGSGGALGLAERGGANTGEVVSS